MRSVMARTGRLPRVAREAVQALGLGSPRPLPDERRPDMLAPVSYTHLTLPTILLV